MARLRIIVTGASGFIGSRLVRKLSLSGHDVMCLTRSSNLRPSNDNIQWISADISLPRTYQDQVRKFKPNVLIHLSWQDIPNFSLAKSKLNLNQSIDFLSFILEMDSCSKIIVSGSCFELNQLQGQCLETSMGEARDHFTWAKNSLYSWLRMMSKEKDFELMWMRVFYAYGPGQRSASLIPSILVNFKKGILPEILTPKNANDFIFIDDVVNALSKAILVNNASMIYNLGSGSSSSILDVCRIAEKIVLGSSKLTDEIERVSLDTNSNIDFWADTTHSKKYLDWHPKVTLEDGIKKTWNWLKLK